MDVKDRDRGWWWELTPHKGEVIYYIREESGETLGECKMAKFLNDEVINVQSVGRQRVALKIVETLKKLKEIE